MKCGCSGTSLEAKGGIEESVSGPMSLANVVGSCLVEEGEEEEREASGEDEEEGEKENEKEGEKKERRRD